MNNLVKWKLLAKYFENQQHNSAIFVYDITHIEISKKKKN